MTAISVKSVVPPPISTTRIRSPTVTCSRQFGIALRSRSRRRPAALRAEPCSCSRPAPRHATSVRAQRRRRTRDGNQYGLIVRSGLRDARCSMRPGCARGKPCDAATGEILPTPSGAVSGSSAAVRSTPPYDSQDLADDTSRPAFSDAALLRELAGDCDGRFVPGQGEGVRREIVRAREVEKRRQQDSARTSPGFVSCGIAKLRRPAAVRADRPRRRVDRRDARSWLCQDQYR